AEAALGECRQWRQGRAPGEVVNEDQVNYSIETLARWRWSLQFHVSYSRLPEALSREQRTASGPLDSWIQANPGAAHQPPGSPRRRSRRVFDMQTIKQLRRFYVAEVFQPQPPIAGSQRAETVLSQRECLCSEALYTTSQPHTHRRDKPFNSSAVSISSPSNPTGYG